MEEDELRILKETLENQQITIRRLQNELDEERKASASGTQEALSMILRLQEEKSNQKLEYLQYKRMMEEKLRHDEESLAILREIIFLKDMEIEASKYQIQGYKRKLLSACVKEGFPWLSEFRCLSRKNVSLPSFRLEELCSEIGSFGEESFSSNFDGFEKKLFGNCTGRKFENLFRSKSSTKEVFTMDDESRFDPCTSTSVVRNPRRTSSVVMLPSPCTEPEFVSNLQLQDIFEIPESLERTRKPNSDFGSNKSVERDNMESKIDEIKVKIESIDRKIGETRQNDSVSLELLKEIHNKVNWIQDQMQKKNGEIQELERENEQIQVSEIRRYPSRKPSRKEHDDLLMSYYIEAMLSFSI